jgi:hypothetical protein
VEWEQPHLDREADRDERDPSEKERGGVVAGQLGSEVSHVQRAGERIEEADPEEVEGRLYMGLGDSQGVDRLIIRWPSGRSETLSELTPGSYVIFEGAGGVWKGKN